MRDQSSVAGGSIMSDNHDMNTKKISVTIPANLIEQIKLLAESEKRSFSNMLSCLAEEALKNKAV
jgi:uncharacterized protein with FMN-binding domain